MARLNIGDLSRWLTATATGDPLVQAFSCGEFGTRCRLDVVSAVPVTIEVVGPAGVFPVGVSDPREGPLTVEFVAHGDIEVRLSAAAGAEVAVRRYDDRNVVEVEGDSFTSYDPANFVDGDMERIERLMRHNQLAMMAQLQEKFDAQLARMQSVQGKETGNGAEGSEGGPEGVPQGGSAGREATPQTGEPAADEVTG